MICSLGSDQIQIKEAGLYPFKALDDKLAILTQLNSLTIASATAVERNYWLQAYSRLPGAIAALALKSTHNQAKPRIRVQLRAWNRSDLPTNFIED